jgi:hypothetical protein
MDKLFNSDQARAIIFGSLLGDGSLKIHNGYKNARFSYRHSKTKRSTIIKRLFTWK